MDVVALAFVEQDGKFLLAQQLGHTARGRNVAGGQGGKRRGVKIFRFTRGGDELAVLIHEEHDLGIGLGKEALEFRVYELKLFVIHHEILTQHRCFSLGAERHTAR